MTIEIYEFKNMPGMRSAEVTIELEPRGAAATDAAIHIDYEVGLGVVGAGMNALGMKRMFAKSLSGLLAGLKYHVETGHLVDSRTELQLDAVSAG